MPLLTNKDVSLIMRGRLYSSCVRSSMLHGSETSRTGCIGMGMCYEKMMEYEVEGSRPRGRPKRTWKEVVREDCQACKLNKEDAVDRCKWRKVTKEVR